jgi:serine/threonine protein kinase
MELAPKGELFSQIRRLGSFNLECTRYYAATVLDAVSFIHSMNIIHRDLKPENILLDANMRIKITDFGSAKDKSIAVITTSGQFQVQIMCCDTNVNQTEQARKGSFVGTPEYASPEMLVPPTITTRASDIWAYGCIVFQCISGRPPFKGSTAYLTMKKIQECDYSFPDDFDPVVRTLVERCLVNNPTIRITSGELRNHPFFSSIDWDTLWKQTPPTLQPGLVIAPEEVEQDLRLDLTWTIDGSENEMEDLRPHAGSISKGAHHAHLVAEVTASMSQNLAIHEAQNDSPQTAIQPIDGMKAPGSSSDTKKKSRRFSHPSDVEKTPVTAAMIYPSDESRHKVRRASLNSDLVMRPRRASPSSMDSKLPINSQRLPEEEEDEDNSEVGSGESPSSTLEHGESSNKSAEKGPETRGRDNGLHPTLGHGKGLSLSSSMDTTLMSTSGTSAASRSSGNFNNGTSSSKGFEMVRGGKGVELGTSSGAESSSTKANWVNTNG